MIKRLKIRTYLWSKKVRPFKRTLLEALSRCLPLSQIEKVVEEDSDWRTLVARSANIMKIDELDLLEKISRSIKLPLLKRVASVDFDAYLPFSDLSLMVKNAFIPVVSDDIAVGYACVDPSRLLRILPDVSRDQLYLASWNSINSALRISEENFRIAQRKKKIVARRKQKKLVFLALSQLVGELKKYQVLESTIRLTKQSVSYSFRMVDGRKGEGRISEYLRESLVDELNANAVKGTVLISQHRLAVEVLSPNECFSLKLVEDVADHQEEIEKKSLAESLSNAKLSFGGFEPLIRKGECSICVIEDNECFARILKDFLERKNFKVRLYYNGDMALRDLGAKELPDIIVCDVHMPKMNGYEFVRRLRSNTKYRQIPVLMLTSDRDIETELKFLSYGVEAFIAKNQDPRLLEGHILRIMQRTFESAGSGREAA